MDAEGRHAGLLAHARLQEALGEDPERIIASLRSRSASVMECIKVMRELMGISLGEAKNLVHFSDAWADLRQTHEDLHESAIRALEASNDVAEDEGAYRFRVDLTRGEHT